MAMHDVNSSDHFDGGDTTTGFTVAKNMRLGLGVRSKRREAIMSKSPTLKKRSRKRKRLIPIGKEVGGYKKARKRQYRHRGLKKRSLGEKSKVKEPESGKTHNKEQVKPCGSQTGPYEEEYSSSDDFPSVGDLDEEAKKLLQGVEIKSESETESFSTYLEKGGSNILTGPSEEILEYRRNKPYSSFADLLVELETDFQSDYDFGNARLRRRYLAHKNLYGAPTKAQEELNKLLGVKDPSTSWTLSQEEVDKLFRPMPWLLSDSDPDSDSGFIRRTRKRRK